MYLLAIFTDRTVRLFSFSQNKIVGGKHSEKIPNRKVISNVISHSK